MRVILIICDWEKYPLVNVCELESSMSPKHLEKAVRKQKVNSKLFPRPFTEMSSRWSWDNDFTDNSFWIQRKRIRLWSHRFASGKKIFQAKLYKCTKKLTSSPAVGIWKYWFWIDRFQIKKSNKQRLSSTVSTTLIPVYHFRSNRNLEMLVFEWIHDV